MRIQAVKRLERVKFIEDVDCFTGYYLQYPATSLDLKVQVAQAFEQKVIVLSRSICAAPQRGFDDVQAKHWAVAKCLRQRRVVTKPQITFKPNNAVTHAGANGLCGAKSR
jgi:hypothetical protein